MGAADVAERLRQVAVDALVDCERPVERSGVYWGTAPRIFPCPRDGEITVYVPGGFSMSDFGRRAIPSPGTALVRGDDYWVRLIRCYPGLSEAGQPANIDETTVATDTLLDDLDCLWRALQNAVCGLLAEVRGCQNIALVDWRAMQPRAKHAAVEIHLIAEADPVA